MWNCGQDGRTVCLHKNSINSCVIVVSWKFHTDRLVHSKKKCMLYSKYVTKKNCRVFHGVLFWFGGFGVFIFSQAHSLFHLNIGKRYQKFYENFVSVFFFMLFYLKFMLLIFNCYRCK